jgi:hypothetical protein
MQKAHAHSMDLNFPEPTSPLKRPKDVEITWEQWMRETATRTRIYLRDHYDPEERLRNKVSEPFVWIEPKGSSEATEQNPPEV